MAKTMYFTDNWGCWGKQKRIYSFWGVRGHWDGDHGLSKSMACRGTIMSPFMRTHTPFILKEMLAFIRDCRSLQFIISYDSIPHSVLPHRKERRSQDSNSWVPFTESVQRQCYFRVTWENWDGTSKQVDLQNNILYLKLQANRAQLQCCLRFLSSKCKRLTPSHRELSTPGPFPGTCGTLKILSSIPKHGAKSKELRHLCKAHSHQLTVSV